MSCGSTLQARHLVPVLSWCFLQGRAACCGVRISKQYPIVELLTAFLFAFIAVLMFPPLLHTVALFLVSLLILITVYDALHTVIPDEWVYAFLVTAIIFRSIILLGTGDNLFETVLYTLICAISIAAPLYFLWFITQGRGIGFGDVKLGLGIGALLGLANGLLALGLSFVVGAIFSVGILLPLPWYIRIFKGCGLLANTPKPSFTMKSEVPFGPFLIFGTLLIWFLTLTFGETSILGFLGLASL